VQKRHLSPEILAEDPPPTEEVKKPAAQPQKAAAADPKPTPEVTTESSDDLQHRRELIAASRGQQRKQVPRAAASGANQPFEAPAGFVKLAEFLDEFDLSCDPGLVRTLLRIHKLPKALRDTQNNVCADEEADLQLVDIIQEYQIADPGMESPQDIAETPKFATLGIKDTHVVHLALTGKLVETMEGRAQARRARLEGDQPGELRLHYDARLAQILRQRLTKIAGNRGSLAALLRFQENIHIR